MKTLPLTKTLVVFLLIAAFSPAQTACDPASTPTVAPATTPRVAELPATPPASAPTLAPTPPATATPPAPTATATPASRPTAIPPEVTTTPVPSALKALHSLKTRTMSPGATGPELADLTRGNTAFAFDLYRTLAQSDGNLFYSPYSISLALAMTYAGARGETERQMAETLRFLLPQERLHPAFNALDLALASRGARSAGKDGNSFHLYIANSVWGQEDHKFFAVFLDVLAEQYGSEVRRADFRRAPEEARARINDWVADETEARIKDLIPPGAIQPATRLALANAIYFNAAWQLPFDERATAPGPFHPLGGGQIEAPMMRQDGRLGYTRGDGYQAVELPYEGGQMAMVILLPDAGRFSEFEGLLDASMVEGILEDLRIRRVFLTMPKFEVRASFDLADTLKAMGMPDAFDERAADFSGMDGTSCLTGDDGCLVVPDVVHQAFVSVDEAGTEAAATTAVIAGTTSVDPGEPVWLTVDRPFIFMVQGRETGAVLLVGRVSDLEQSS